MTVRAAVWAIGPSDHAHLTRRQGNPTVRAAPDDRFDPTIV